MQDRGRGELGMRRRGRSLRGMRDTQPTGSRFRTGVSLALTLLAASVSAGACQSTSPDAPPPPPVFPDDYAVLDLTRPLDPDAPFLPHAEGFRFERVALGGDSAGRLVGAWSVLDTMGTHLETPAVFGEGDGRVESVPAARLVLPVRTIDAPPMPVARDDDAAPPAATVGIPRLLAHEALHGRIPGGSAVVLRTGVGATSSRELGMAGRVPEAGARHAGWSVEAIRFLAFERGVYLVGTDALVVDSSDAGDDAPAARAAAEAGLLTLQALADLSGLPRRGAVLVVGALRVSGARAAPARVLALVPPERRDTASAASPHRPAQP